MKPYPNYGITSVQRTNYLRQVLHGVSDGSFLYERSSANDSGSECYTALAQQGKYLEHVTNPFRRLLANNLTTIQGLLSREYIIERGPGYGSTNKLLHDILNHATLHTDPTIIGVDISKHTIHEYCKQLTQAGYTSGGVIADREQILGSTLAKWSSAHCVLGGSLSNLSYTKSVELVSAFTKGLGANDIALFGFHTPSQDRDAIFDAYSGGPAQTFITHGAYALGLTPGQCLPVFRSHDSLLPQNTQGFDCSYGVRITPQGWKEGIDYNGQRLHLEPGTYLRFIETNRLSHSCIEHLVEKSGGVISNYFDEEGAGLVVIEKA